MACTTLCLGLALALSGRALALAAQPPPSDEEVATGIHQVQEGEYDAAILTLDNAARRLAADPKGTKELSQAYLYLGIAYLGKGHEAAAKAKFREAVAQLRDLSLSPEKFPPKVIDLFEAAKEEARKASPPPTASAEKKGGSKKGLILLGVGGAAAAGAAVALGGGGGSGTGGAGSRRTETFNGSVGRDDPNGEYFEHRIVPTTAGTLDATVTWMNRDVELRMRLLDDNNPVAASSPASNTEARLSASVTNKTYMLEVRIDSGGPVTAYVLRVTYP